MTVQQLEEHLNTCGQYFNPKRFDKVMKIALAEYAETNGLTPVGERV